MFLEDLPYFSGSILAPRTCQKTVYCRFIFWALFLLPQNVGFNAILEPKAAPKTTHNGPQEWTQNKNVPDRNSKSASRRVVRGQIIHPGWTPIRIRLKKNGSQISKNSKEFVVGHICFSFSLSLSY